MRDEHSAIVSALLLFHLLRIFTECKFEVQRDLQVLGGEDPVLDLKHDLGDWEQAPDPFWRIIVIQRSLLIVKFPDAADLWAHKDEYDHDELAEKQSIVALLIENQNQCRDDWGAYQSWVGDKARP